MVVLNQAFQWLLRSLVMVVVALISVQCANPVAPTGGPRDTTPPVIIQAVPENETVNFHAENIRIWFDEFVVLRELHQQFLSSPPFAKMPDITIRGKSLQINIDEELKPNTTYTLYFGNAIVDFRESNPLAEFRYVFSTGTQLDSMEISGKIVNAYSHQPEKGVLIMLYDQYHDSIPYQHQPYYVARSGEDGSFRFTHLRNIPYKIFALRDANNNMLFDLPNEEIAFLDTLLYPTEMQRVDKESLSSGDTVHISNIHANCDHGHDTLLKPDNQIIETLSQIVNQNYTDTVVNEIAAAETLPLKLFLFMEADTVQRIERAAYAHPNRIEFSFRTPVDSVSIYDIMAKRDFERIDEWSRNRDTLWCWLPLPLPDSVHLLVSGHKYTPDTIFIEILQPDNQTFERGDGEPKPSLGIVPNIPRTGLFHLYKPVEFLFSEPIATIDSGMIKLLQDSIVVMPVISFSDEESRRRLQVEFPWQSATEYSIFIPDSVFTGIYGHSHDTLEVVFTTRSLEDYGHLQLTLTHRLTEGKLLIHLMDSQEKVLSSASAALEDKLVEFPFLLPGTYKLRFIYDRNANGRWDSGIYLAGRQPEAVHNHHRSIEVRANWKIEEPVELPASKE